MIPHDRPPDKAREAPGILDALGSDDVLAVARAYQARGLSVIPVKCDGSKSPQEDGWRSFSERRATLAELSLWFRSRRAGIGIVGGPASGHLVVLDFETWDAFSRWARSLDQTERTALARCPIVFTPSGGVHVYVRLTESVKGAKYARNAAGKCLIETRGNGHLVLAPGCPSACHPTGRHYRLHRAGWLDGGPFEAMAVELFHGLTLRMVALNEYVKPTAREVIGDRAKSSNDAVGDRPGDHFNVRVKWGDILSPGGWRVFQSSQGVTYWTRPGKAAGISASTGFCRGDSGNDLLYVFSTSAPPFEAERSYSRFATYALLNHHGNWTAATRALRLAGYGKPLPALLRNGRRNSGGVRV